MGKTYYSWSSYKISSPSILLIGSFNDEAIEYLRNDLKFDGDILVADPLPENGFYDPEKEVAWESWAKQKVDAIVFWIPKDISTFYLFTSAVHFGTLLMNGYGYKMILGYEGYTNYTDYLYSYYESVFGDRMNSIAHSLKDVLKDGVRMAMERRG